MSLRLVMMGTGTFALPTFQSLYDSSHEVVGLYTQPDRTGRGHHRHRNPLKELAIEQGTPVFQPIRANAPESLEELQQLQPDLCVVAAYGQILSEELLKIPRLGAINLHASLLPKFRGAAPIQHAIWHGESESGITIFQIIPKLDAGPILAMHSLEIAPNETAGELETRLAQFAVQPMLKTIDLLETSSAKPIAQQDAEATLAPRLQKSDGQIDWSKTAEEIGWHVRAMQPWPKPFTMLQMPDRRPSRLIILEVASAEESASAGPPGSTVVASPQQLIVNTGQGCLEIKRLQPEGKRAMTAAEFLRGHPIGSDARFVAAE